MNKEATLTKGGRGVGDLVIRRADFCLRGSKFNSRLLFSREVTVLKNWCQHNKNKSGGRITRPRHWF